MLKYQDLLKNNSGKTTFWPWVNAWMISSFCSAAVIIILMPGGLMFKDGVISFESIGAFLLLLVSMSPLIIIAFPCTLLINFPLVVFIWIPLWIIKDKIPWFWKIYIAPIFGLIASIIVGYILLKIYGPNNIPKIGSIGDVVLLIIIFGVAGFAMFLWGAIISVGKNENQNPNQAMQRTPFGRR